MRIHPRLIAIVGIALAMTAQADIPTDPARVRPWRSARVRRCLRARVPTARLRTFSPDGYQRPTIVIFYRGGWCPYCNMQLSDLRLVEPELRERGFEIVFLSTDRPDILYSSLKATDIHYTLLSDSHLEAARPFMLLTAWTRPSRCRRNTASTSRRPPARICYELPVPSVFIIDTSGTIRYVYSESGPQDSLR